MRFHKTFLYGGYLGGLGSAAFQNDTRTQSQFTKVVTCAVIIFLGTSKIEGRYEQSLRY